jgi:spore maturation protein CgeB
MARILMVHPGPDFSVADVFNGWHKALKKMGHEVMVYNTNDRLIFYGRSLFQNDGEPECGGHPDCECKSVALALPEPEQVTQMATKGLFDTCFLFWPDVVFFVSAFFQKASTFEVLRKRNMKIVMLHTESPYQDDEQMMRGQFADLNLLNDPVNIEAWRELDIPVKYAPHSYDPEVHYVDALGVPKESDFTFVGTAFASRQKFFHEMDFTSLRVTLAGNGWDSMLLPEYKDILKFLGHDATMCVENAETARVYRLSKTGINFYRREGEDTHVGEGWAMGPREVEMAACGLFFLRDPRGESDEVFGGSKALGIPDILPTFTNPGDASDQIKWWVKHDEERRKYALLARDRIIDRTFDVSARNACRWMEEAGIL